MTYRLEVAEREVEHKKKVAKLTISPSEERISLKLSKNVDEQLLESLIFLSNHIRNTVDADLTLRGYINFRYDSMLEVKLQSDNKKEKRSFLLDLTDNQFKTFKEFSQGRI